MLHRINILDEVPVYIIPVPHNHIKSGIDSNSLMLCRCGLGLTRPYVDAALSDLKSLFHVDINLSMLLTELSKVQFCNPCNVGYLEDNTCITNLIIIVLLDDFCHIILRNMLSSTYYCVFLTLMIE